MTNEEIKKIDFDDYDLHPDVNRMKQHQRCLIIPIRRLTREEVIERLKTLGIILPP